MVARVAAFNPPPSTIVNGLYDSRFTSFEMIEVEYDDDGEVVGDGYYCGWCHEPNCGNDDQECRPLRFFNKREFEDFCAAYSLSTNDDTDSTANVWAHSMLHRTHSKRLTMDGIEDLTEIQFGQRIRPN